MTTLIPEQNLLTEQLQAAVNHERVKLRIEDLRRAERYLRAAGEAARRYSNCIKLVREYQYAHWRGRAWTLINNKEELMQMAARNSNRYKAFMEWQQKIVLKEIAK